MVTKWKLSTEIYNCFSIVGTSINLYIIFLLPILINILSKRFHNHHYYVSCANGPPQLYYLLYKSYCDFIRQLLKLGLVKTNYIKIGLCFVIILLCLIITLWSFVGYVNNWDSRMPPQFCNLHHSSKTV